MTRNSTEQVRESYNRLAHVYAHRYVDELESKPLDRELLNRLVADVKGRGDVCDIGCGPGHIARFLRDAGARVFERECDYTPNTPMGPRHGSTVTSVSLPSRYTFPSVLRTKTRMVEDSVSGSSRASIQYDIYSSTSRPSPFSRFESTRTTTPCRSLGASSVSTVNLNRCPTFMIDCIVLNRPFWFANNNTSTMVELFCAASPRCDQWPRLAYQSGQFS